MDSFTLLMKKIAQNWLVFFVILILGCQTDLSVQTEKKVFIKKENGKYSFYRNGNPFIVKGVAGYTHIKELSESGGNTIRTWDTMHLDQILEQANLYHVAVVVGLFIPDNKNMQYFYNDEANTKHQLEVFTAFIRKYKNNPAILCWCLGNELTFPFKLKYNSFYSAFSNIVDMIHREDPDHPVTTTMVNFQKKNIFNILYRTKIDFISINTFGGLRFIKEDLASFEWLWKGPFMITEWGIDGPWGFNAQTRWGAYLESNSTKKANDYLQLYKQYVPVNNPRYLGSLAFYWGYKQEYTHTWFSIFNNEGASSAPMSALAYIWTGRKPADSFPALSHIQIKDWPKETDYIFNADSSITAVAVFDSHQLGNLKINWEILPEDWFTVNTIHSLRKPDPLSNLIINDSIPETRIKTPSTEGPYRIFLEVSDQKGHFASCNLPIYIISKSLKR